MLVMSYQKIEELKARLGNYIDLVSEFGIRDQ